MLMHRLLTAWAERRPEKRAFRWVDRDRALSYGEAADAMERMAGGLASVGTGNLLLTGSLLLWSLGLLSSVVNNVPLAAAAGPLIARVGVDSGLPTSPLIYATSIGTDIGGNGTPIGASANVVALSTARRSGVTVSWGGYIRRAFPVMLASLAASNVVWLFVH